MIKIRIDTPRVTVEIEADGTLDVVTDKALEAFHAAGGWPQDTPGSAVGFQAERRWTAEVAPVGSRAYDRGQPPRPATARASYPPTTTEETP